MKTVKKYMLLYGAITLISAAFILAGSLGKGDIVRNLGFGLLAGSIFKILQYAAILKSPEKMKQYEIRQYEERNIYLADKSRSLMFVVTIFVQFFAVVISSFLGKEEIAAAICFVICAELVIYLLIYLYYRKRF